MKSSKTTCELWSLGSFHCDEIIVGVLIVCSEWKRGYGRLNSIPEWMVEMAANLIIAEDSLGLTGRGKFVTSWTPRGSYITDVHVMYLSDPLRGKYRATELRPGPSTLGILPAIGNFARARSIVAGTSWGSEE